MPDKIDKKKARKMVTTLTDIQNHSKDEVTLIHEAIQILLKLPYSIYFYTCVCGRSIPANIRLDTTQKFCAHAPGCPIVIMLKDEDYIKEFQKLLNGNQ